MKNKPKSFRAPPPKKKSAQSGSNVHSHLHRKFPKWLLAALLYGISWYTFTGINFSFMAWFAFIPLFVDLENRNTFRAFYSRAFFFSAITYSITCHGFLFTAFIHPFIFIGAADELFLTSISFALIYPFKKRYGFKTALLIFPFVISLWEWLYQQLEHTTGYPMLSNSQCGNTQLIQYIDIFGVWSIAFWVMAFNVLLFIQYKKFIANPKSLAVKKSFAFICFVMIVPPWCYYAYKNSHYNKTPSEPFNLTLINTRFSLSEGSPDNWVNKIERLTFLTDSIDYELKKNQLKSDLYVWHEGVIDFGNEKNVIAFIDTAVNDWKTPLLSGMQFIPEDAAESDLRRVNRAALFDVDSHENNPNQYYDKVRLFPVREKIPYHRFFAQIPFFPYPLDDPAFFREGAGIKLIEVKTQTGNIIKIGTPICQEQNYSTIWSDMALEGADCFVQLSFESWWTIGYFKRQMADITRLRCIETGRSAARCSNAGVTAFIDALGRIYSPAGNKEGVTRANLLIHNGGASFFTRHQKLFPLLCLAIAVVIIIYSERRKFIKTK